MSAYPPAETPLFHVFANGVRPVVFRRSGPDASAQVSLAKGTLVRDPNTGRQHRDWSLVTQQVMLADLFGCRETAEAEFQRRGGHSKQRKAA